MIPPTLDTPRLTLRLLAPGDAEDVFACCRDPEVARDTSWSAQRSVDEARGTVAWAMAANTGAPPAVHHIWALRRRDEAQVLGTIDLIQDSATDAHTDYVLGRPLWGQGLVTEAVGAVTAWAFRHIPALARVRSLCLTRNVGSCRVLEKSGFVLLGCAPVQFGAKFGNQVLDVSRFELKRPG